jgi:hypothetical protein
MRRRSSTSASTCCDSTPHREISRSFETERMASHKIALCCSPRVAYRPVCPIKVNQSVPDPLLARIVGYGGQVIRNTNFKWFCSKREPSKVEAAPSPLCPYARARRGRRVHLDGRLKKSSQYTTNLAYSSTERLRRNRRFDDADSTDDTDVHKKMGPTKHTKDTNKKNLSQTFASFRVFRGQEAARAWIASPF